MTSRGLRKGYADTNETSLNRNEISWTKEHTRTNMKIWMHKIYTYTTCTSMHVRVRVCVCERACVCLCKYVSMVFHVYVCMCIRPANKELEI